MGSLALLIVRSSAAVALAALTTNGNAQCLDWLPGFASAQNGVNDQVHAMTVFDDGAGPALYVAGKFSSAGMVPVNGIAKWTGFDWSSVGDGLGTVQALAVYDDGGGPELYAAGQFHFVGGVEFNYIAKWNGMAWEKLGTGLGNNAACLAVFDDGAGPELYVGGSFTSAGGAPTDHIASWNGARWRTWNAGPSARTRFGLAYDDAREEVVLFAGTTNGGGSGAEADTWTFDAAGWTQAATSGAGTRFGCAIAYDSLRGRTIVAGGSGSYDSSTSAWDGTSWSALLGNFITPPRQFLDMTYDAARDRVVLFGGRADNLFLGDTWEFDGVSWMQVTPAAIPPVRAEHGMAYDAARSRVVVFGGRSLEGALGDTWEYDGTTWIQVATTGPSARFAMGMAYDSLRERVVMTGGIAGSPQQDTWAWDGTTWTLLDPGNAAWPFRPVPMVYDAARDLMVQRVENATWLFDGASWSVPPSGGLNNEVRCMGVHDDGSGPALYVGGTFTSAAGISAMRIARWNGATWSGVGGGANGAVEAVAEFDGDLYVGGTFFDVGGAQANNIARWDGAAWSQVGPDAGGAGVNDPVLDLFTADLGNGPTLFVAGSFTHAVDLPASRIAGWNGTDWSALGTGLSPGAIGRAMKTFDDGTGPRLYVGGSFTSAGGLPSSNLAAYGSTCSAPVITFPPLHTEAVFGQSVIFTVTAIGTGPLSYQWRHNGVDLQNDAGHIFGANTDRLELQAWSLNDAGSYDVVVSNKYGSETSDPATLTIPLAGVAGPVEVTRVLVPPAPVPGSPGEQFTSLFTPLVSPTGEVTFDGRINATRSLGRWDAGAISVGFRAGQQAPGMPPGNNFAFDNSGISSFQTYMVAEDWRVAFTSDMQGPDITGPGDRRGIWFADSESEALVARAGSPAPGTPPFLFYNTPRLGGVSDNSVVAFQSIFTLTPNGSYAGAGIWAWTPKDGLALHARTGSPAPGTMANFLFINEPPRVNAGGTVAFLARLNSTTGFNYSGETDYGLWLGPPGSPTLVVKGGDPAPGFSDHNIELIASWLLNDQGDVIVQAFVAGPAGSRSEALYVCSTTGPQLVLKRGDPAPGANPGQTFFSMTPACFNNAGQAIFYAQLTGNGPTWGIWFVDGMSVQPVLLRNQIGLPGLPPNGRLENIETVAMNSQGQVVIGCNVVVSASHRAVFGWAQDIELFPIVVPGTQIEIAEDEYRTAFNAYLSSVVGGESGLSSRALNDDGRIVFQTQLARLSGQGVFVGQFDDFLGGYVDCPLFTGQPADTEVIAGRTAVLGASAVGSGELSYQWRRNEAPVVDDARITGSATDTLTIASASEADAGTYDLVVTNACGSSSSDAAALTVFCAADWNRSGLVNSQDFFDFLGAFFQDLPSSDVNDDGLINSQDFFDFLVVFFTGCP